MKAGRLREKVRFERKTSGAQTVPGDDTDEFGNPIDESGNSVGEFGELLSVMADIRETPGREAVASGAVESTRTATVRVRYSSATFAITPADRAVFRGATWKIRSGPVRVDRVPEVLEFLCETGVAT